ncbi:MAG: plasmid mobilization protein [Acidimicrobiales bacterium]
MGSDVGTSGPWAGGRRARQPGGRHRRMKVRLTEDEAAELDRRARRAGVSPQRYLWEQAMESGRPTVSERRHRVATFAGLLRQLVRLNAQLEQLAGEATATGRLPAGTAGVLAGAEHLAGSLTEAAERLADAFERPAPRPRAPGGGRTRGHGAAPGRLGAAPAVSERAGEPPTHDPDQPRPHHHRPDQPTHTDRPDRPIAASPFQPSTE